MRLSPRDKKVIDSFLKKKPGESNKLYTDGESLDILGMGGSGIAAWKSGGVFIGRGHPSGKNDQTVIRALLKQGGSVVKYRPVLKFRDESTASYSGQVNMLLSATDLNTDQTVGYIEYSYFEDEAYIQYMFVEEGYRRLGVGTAMVKELNQTYGKRNVVWGGTTPSGTALKKRTDLVARVASRFLRLGGGFEGIVSRWEKKGLEIFVYENVSGFVILSELVVPKELQDQGVGTAFMKDITRWADSAGKDMALTPDTTYGATSVGRLKKFYKRFEFVENKGRNKDYRIGETMIRRAQ